MSYVDAAEEAEYWALAEVHKDARTPEQRARLVEIMSDYGARDRANNPALHASIRREIVEKAPPELREDIARLLRKADARDN